MLSKKGGCRLCGDQECGLPFSSSVIYELYAQVMLGNIRQGRVKGGGFLWVVWAITAGRIIDPETEIWTDLDHLRLGGGGLWGQAGYQGPEVFHWRNKGGG
uniref:Uncharacterized protein n=1 Tax=Eutreptiella gymnastica TaxID=73025 RepID=A0A7S1ITE6_9EUGL